MLASHATGRRAEEAAARYLIRRGWTLVARNWHGAGGEIDIAATRRGVLAVCEVKARTDAEALFEVLTAAQRERIVRAASALITSRAHLADHIVRFDLITVHPRRTWSRIRHLPAVFEPTAESARPRRR